MKPILSGEFGEPEVNFNEFTVQKNSRPVIGSFLMENTKG
jgi:hypothetical protein